MILLTNIIYLICYLSFIHSYSIRSIIPSYVNNLKLQKHSIISYTSINSMNNQYIDNINNQSNDSNKKKSLISNLSQSGLLAYGILNFIYYISITSITWFTITLKSSTTNEFILVNKNMNIIQKYSNTIIKLGKVMGIVWAGSQITKAFRLSGAIICAPIADKLIDYIQQTFHIQNRTRVFSILVTSLLSLTLLFYISIITISILS